MYYLIFGFIIVGIIITGGLLIRELFKIIDLLEYLTLRGIKMIDSDFSKPLFRIQCMKCRTDIIFIKDNGVIEKERGTIWIGDIREINIHCDSCGEGVECEPTV